MTPLPALGIDFDIEERRGPVIANPLRSAGQLSELHELDLGRLGFVGDALRTLRGEVAPDAAVLGFVGCPWTLATYIVEGGSTRTFTTIKSMCYTGAVCSPRARVYVVWRREWEVVRKCVGPGAA